MLGENHFTSPSYTANPLLYLTHCKQLDILPIRFRFDFHDLILLHSTVYGYSYCKLPSYLTFFEGSRLRFCHLDKLCLVSSLKPKSLLKNMTETNHGINNAYFYRLHLIWNKLPLEIRQIEPSNRFRSELTNWIWESEISSIINKDCDSEVDLSGSDLE